MKIQFSVEVQFTTRQNGVLIGRDRHQFQCMFARNSAPKLGEKLVIPLKAGGTVGHDTHLYFNVYDVHHVFSEDTLDVPQIKVYCSGNWRDEDEERVLTTLTKIFGNRT